MERYSGVSVSSKLIAWHSISCVDHSGMLERAHIFHSWNHSCRWEDDADFGFSGGWFIYPVWLSVSGIQIRERVSKVDFLKFGDCWDLWSEPVVLDWFKRFGWVVGLSSLDGVGVEIRVSLKWGWPRFLGSFFLGL